MDFNYVYSQYYKLVVSKFSRQFGQAQAEEHAQEVFILVYKNLHKYDPQHSITSFLQMYVGNVYSKLGRVHAAWDRDTVTLVSITLAADVEDTGALQAFETASRNVALAASIEALDVNRVSKAILRMRLIEGRSSLEVQALTAKNAKYVKDTSRIAYRRLAAQMGVDL